MYENEKVDLDNNVENELYSQLDLKMNNQEVDPIYLDSLIQMYIAIQLKHLRRLINMLGGRM